MKNITKSIIALFAVVALSCSVEDVQDRPVIEGIDSPVLTAPATGASYVLKQENNATQAERFTWKSANYGGNVQVTYAVEIDKKGNAFKTPQSIGSVISANQVSVSVEQLNNAAVVLKAASGSPVEFEVRVKSSTGAMAPMYSNVVGIIINSYNPVIPKRQLFLVGDATAAGWNVDKNTNDALFRDSVNDNLYTYTGYFGTGDVKLIEKRGLWQPQWGTNAGTALAVNPGAGTDPGSFKILTAGYYTFVVNIATMTVSLTPFTASTATTYATIGLVGDSTSGGWDVSTPMVKSTFDPHIWRVGVTLTKGKLKFRANNAWAVSWGQGGADILVEAGKYDIYFNDLDGKYILIPVQ
ncbi:SusE domain-containing protein [Flavobacterium sp. LB3P45]|uniref:SusE domain-containing protein n=1 Tax=Flavobacterium fructosi TaxID=3230416 RepID=A0ABW6HJR8_9FLAO